MLRPQAVFAPLSRLAATLEPAAEPVLIGVLGRLSWLLVAYGTFPGRRRGAACVSVTRP